MSCLEYWFDERKITGADENAKKTAVKQKFQEMMLQNGTLTQRGTEVFNAIFNNNDLKVSLFQGRDINDSKSFFITMLDDLSNSFYEFINVK